MKDIFLTLNQVQTHVITWGEPSHCNGSDLIICMTGSPGIPDFYAAFGAALHEYTKLPVCVIGQAGHEEVPDKLSNQLKNQHALFNLQGQIQHKIDFIDKYIDKDSKLHLMGHSIGSWLLLEMLDKNDRIRERVSSVNLLFPTVQKMAQSSSGLFLNNVIRIIHPLLMILITLLHILPVSIKTILASFYLSLRGISQTFERSMVKLCNPKVIEKVLFLAYNGMDRVTSLNIDSLEKIKNVTNVLYTTRDEWAPLHYRRT